MKILKFVFVLAFFTSALFFPACKSGSKEKDRSYVKTWDSIKNVVASYDADIQKLKAEMKTMNEERMSCSPKKGKETTCDSLKESCKSLTEEMESAYNGYKEVLANAEKKSAELKEMLDKADKGDKSVTEEKLREAYMNAVAELQSAINMYNPKNEESQFKTVMKNCEENCKACEGICEGSKTETKKEK